MNRNGFTLPEVLMALAVLALGLAAIAGLQLLSLRLGSSAGRQARLLETARNELNHRLLTGSPGPGCQTPLEADQSCSVSERHCSVSSGQLDCTAASGPVREVTVTVGAPSAEPLRLTGYALTGARP